MIALLDIRNTPLDVAEVLAAVEVPAAGGVSIFVGNVRDHDGGQAVGHLEYSEHPTALLRLREVAEEVAAEFDVLSLAAVHRVGRLEIGDAAVIVAIATAHRAEAFEACRALIDRLKERVPIWKHQVFTDGSEEWVGTP